MKDGCIDIKSMTVPELAAYLQAAGEPAFRAKQVFAWLHGEQALSYDDMTNLPKALREKLAKEAPLTALSVKQEQHASDGTGKYLLELPDQNLIECVRMRYRFGNSLCVSSQAGCAMGCAFCASTLDGLKRNLTASEMLEEVYTVIRAERNRAQEGQAQEKKPEISRVVLMGMGEPMQNLDNVIRFITLLTDGEGYGMSRRHVTVSTCGLPEGIRRMAKELPQVNLAVSLHAAVQEKRERIMPVARQVTLPELTKACRFHAAETGRQMTFEYALMRGFNDTEEDAEALTGLLSGMGAMVNLIPVNPVRGKEQNPPNKTHVLKIKKNLEKSGIHVTIRREMGREIDGACGQLAGRYRGSNH